ncbi:MAG: hypothetical protein NZM35_11870 [Chitinophagales bacterium]|nr:hypothetical protein [Chitinophagales bacterium]MDW8418490.1 hypothetical protein [Chitinophagales bacterium]
MLSCWVNECVKQLSGAVLFCLALGLFHSCKAPDKGPPVLGSIDTAAIAADTAMQLAMENSYEFSQTLVAGTELVYDVVAWGTPRSGRIAFIRRGGDNRPDTLLSEGRLGTVRQIFITDLDADKQPEVIAFTSVADSLYVIGCETRGVPMRLLVTNMQQSAREGKFQYNGSGEIELYEGAGQIIMRNNRLEYRSKVKKP